MAKALIRRFKIRLEAPPCTPGAEWWHAYADLEDDISEALPYLNAVLENCKYIHDNRHLVSNMNDKTYVFKPFLLAISPIEDTETAENLFKEIVQIINGTWAAKDEITPNFEAGKMLPTALDIFRLLPGTNCGECGFPTCMAFAAQLRTNPANISLCPGLNKEDYSGILTE